MTRNLILQSLRDVHALVCHSVRIPDARADVDHVVVVDGLMVLVDSKLWNRGRYVTVDGVTSRGGLFKKPFPEADKKTLPMALDRFGAQLAGIELAGLVVVHTNDGKANVDRYEPAGFPTVKAVNTRSFGPALLDLVAGCGPADPAMGDWLTSRRY